jgi:hypothetical protein
MNIIINNIIMLIVFFILLLIILYFSYNYLTSEMFENNKIIYKIINNNKECILYKNNNKLLHFNNDLICNDKNIKITKSNIPFIYNININNKEYEFHIENNNEFNLKFNKNITYNIFFNLINNKEVITIRNLNFNKLCTIKNIYKNEYSIEIIDDFDYNIAFTIFKLIKYLRNKNLL